VSTKVPTPQCVRELYLEDFNPKEHFLLDVAHDNLRFNDGTPTRMPDKLNGISGCSIWETAWPRANSADAPQVRIVGVQTSYYRQSCVIRATPWFAVASILHQVRPDLRGAIEMHLAAGTTRRA
jgi:hypothetical protein